MSTRDIYTLASHSGSSSALRPHDHRANSAPGSSFLSEKRSHPVFPQDSLPLPGRPISSFDASFDSRSVGNTPSPSHSPAYADMHPRLESDSDLVNRPAAPSFPQPNMGGAGASMSRAPTISQPPPYTPVAPNLGTSTGASDGAFAVGPPEPHSAKNIASNSRGPSHRPHSSGAHQGSLVLAAGASINTKGSSRGISSPTPPGMDVPQSPSFPQPHMPSHSYQGSQSGQMVTSQPGFSPVMTTNGEDIRNLKRLPKDKDGKRKWGYNICGCMSTCSTFGTCCVACWCPCMIYAQNKSRLEYLDKGQVHPEHGEMVNTDCAVHALLTVITGFGWILQIPLRARERRHFGIRGNGCCDCLAAACCNPCELTQAEREIMDEEIALQQGARPPSLGDGDYGKGFQ